MPMTGAATHVLPNPPATVTLELAASVVCPVACPHCSHRAVPPLLADTPRVDVDMAISLLDQVAALGAGTFVAYPRQGDVSLESESYARLFARARALGLHTKTCSSCVDPAALLALLPTLDQITISVDGFDAADYGRLRPQSLLASVDAFLEGWSRLRPVCRLAANVVATRSFLRSGGLERFAAEVVARAAISKLNVLEILPGPADDYRDERLGPDELAMLRDLKQRFRGRLKITVPAWEVGEPGRPSCPVGRDYLVVGPGGEISACVLLLHGGVHLADLFRDGLAAAWRTVSRVARPEVRERLFEGPSRFPRAGELAPCRGCRLLQEGRCFGGCVARARLFGHQFERARHCRGPVP